MRKRFETVLILLILSFCITSQAFAAPHNWEQIYPDESNIYLDTNSVVKSPEGDMIAFVEKTDLPTPYYKNRAFELETIIYIPRTSQWRRYNHAYYDINYKTLEGHEYSLQTAPWAKVSPNDAVIKRVMEIANGDSVTIIGNQSPAPTTNNQPSQRTSNVSTKTVAICYAFDETSWKESHFAIGDERLLSIEDAKRANVELTQELAKRISQKTKVICGTNVNDVFNNTIKKYENVFGKSIHDWEVSETKTAYKEIIATLNVDSILMVGINKTAIHTDFGGTSYLVNYDVSNYDKADTLGGVAGGAYAPDTGIRTGEIGFRGAISEAAKDIIKNLAERNF